jgi:hypothetical protein
VRLWWNWQTRYFEVVVGQPVQVQVLLSAPTFIEKSGDSQKVCTKFAQKTAQSDRRVKFPVTIRHRSSKAKIYAPGGKFAYYRLAYAVAGKRRMQTFAAYSAARTAAERIVKELADGSQAAALTATQSRDALAAFQRLQSFYESSGRRVSLLGAVSEFVEASGKLNGHTLAEAASKSLVAPHCPFFAFASNASHLGNPACGSSFIASAFTSAAYWKMFAMPLPSSPMLKAVLVKV